MVKIETILYLSDGQIVGKIEENGQTYYYYVSRTDHTEDDKKYSHYALVKVDSDGKQVNGGEYNIVFDNDGKWNV